MNKLDGLSRPFEYVIGATSPVQRMIKILKNIANDKPVPKVATKEAESTSALLFVHLLHLLSGTGQLNGAGYHSVAITLFRPLEDALDCFGAVSLVKGAAEKWMERKLRASDASKMWIELIEIGNEKVTMLEYRKMARECFNQYSHCTPEQAHWNLYLKPIGETKCEMELNIMPMVINSNGHTIDAYLVAHLWELIYIVEKAYEEYLNQHMKLFKEILRLKDEIRIILEEHHKNGCLDVAGATELKRIK